MSTPEFARFISQFGDSIDRWYARSEAARWKLSRDEFAAAMYRSLIARFGECTAPASNSDVVAYLDSLHVKDLALAAACRTGNDDAWAHFIETHKTAIEGFARAAIHDSAQALSIADSIWADLYGLREREGARQSPLDYYHGRSSLNSWLRVVVARKEADAWRSSRSTLPLDTSRVACRELNSSPAEAPDIDRAKLMPALIESINSVIAQLGSDEKLLLSLYYVQEMTLAQIASICGEHESTISRKLARARVAIRKAVEKRLRGNYQFSNDQVSRCFEIAVEDSPLDLRPVLADEK